MGKRSLQGKYVFITGAGSGIGRAPAIAFAREGARITATDLDEQSLVGLGQEIEATGGLCA